MEMSLKKKFPKPHKTTSPKHQEDYVFVEKPGEDFTGLKLISGPFASIVYHYGKVGFRPESEAVDGALPMVFDYTVMENKIENKDNMRIKRIVSLLVCLTILFHGDRKSVV